MEQKFDFKNELAGKIALVTGGTKGAGAAIAERLQWAGATVIITARNRPDEEKDGLHFIAADLGQSEGTTQLVNAVIEKYGRLDILVKQYGGLRNTRRRICCADR